MNALKQSSSKVLKRDPSKLHKLKNEAKIMDVELRKDLGKILDEDNFNDYREAYKAIRQIEKNMTPDDSLYELVQRLNRYGYDSPIHKRCMMEEKLDEFTNDCKIKIETYSKVPKERYVKRLKRDISKALSNNKFNNDELINSQISNDIMAKLEKLDTGITISQDMTFGQLLERCQYESDL